MDFLLGSAETRLRSWRLRLRDGGELHAGANCGRLERPGGALSIIRANPKASCSNFWRQVFRCAGHICFYHHSSAPIRGFFLRFYPEIRLLITISSHGFSYEHLRLGLISLLHSRFGITPSFEAISSQTLESSQNRSTVGVPFFYRKTGAGAQAQNRVSIAERRWQRLKTLWSPGFWTIASYGGLGGYLRFLRKRTQGHTQSHTYTHFHRLSIDLILGMDTGIGELCRTDGVVSMQGCFVSGGGF